MKVTTDGFSFNFTGALDAFVFDETDQTKPTYHGLPMKAVDIVAEFKDEYVFVEVKNYRDSEIYKEGTADAGDEPTDRQKHLNWLKNYLKYKYRDSYLFRHAEDKVAKQIHYICLLAGFENALSAFMQKQLCHELPVGKKSIRWKRSIAASCHVLNVQQWKKNFPKWHLAPQRTANTRQYQSPPAGP